MLLRPLAAHAEHAGAPPAAVGHAAELGRYAATPLSVGGDVAPSGPRSDVGVTSGTRPRWCDVRGDARARARGTAPRAALALRPRAVGGRGTTLRLALAAGLQPVVTVVGGELLATGYPYVRHSRSGRVALTVLAFCPWALAIGLALDHGYHAWTGRHTAATLISALVFGGAMGWNPPSSRRSRRKTRRRRPAA